MDPFNPTHIARTLWHFCQKESIRFDVFSHALQKTYLPLLTNIYSQRQVKAQLSPKQPLFVGINAAQGAGKTTLTKLLCLLFDECFGIHAIHFSIDDFYLTQQERLDLASKVHPLLKTRGVPGTHDIDLAISVFESLCTNSAKLPIQIPRFEKSTDERMQIDHWQEVKKRPDIILFEGWCVGSTAENDSALAKPINEFEAENDPKSIWRNYVNEKLATNYQSLFSFIDYMVFLKAPSFEVVNEWRQEQEEKLRRSISKNINSQNSQLMDDKSIREFIQYFERITQHNFRSMPEQADTVITLNQYRSPVISKMPGF